MLIISVEHWLSVGMILFKQIIEYKAIKPFYIYEETISYRMLQIDKQTQIT